MGSDPGGRDRLADEAARTLVAGLERTLQAAGAAAVPPSDDEIEAYVDGALDEVAREIFEARLAGDPALQGVVDDLRALRTELAELPPAVRGARTSRWRPLALAAAIVLGAGVGSWWLVRQGIESVDVTDRGQRIALGAGGRLDGLPALPDALAAGLGDALRTGRLPVSGALGQVRVVDRPLMSAGAPAAAFHVVEPTGTFVRIDRPRFRWTPLAGASGYVVSLYDARLDPVLASPVVEGVEWTPESALPRDRVLLWQVEALTPDGPQLAPTPPDSQARFAVLSEPAAAAIAARLVDLPASNLVAAFVLAEAGLVDEARAALDALQRENPGQATIARLLASLDADRATARD